MLRMGVGKHGNLKGSVKDLREGKNVLMVETVYVSNFRMDHRESNYT